MIPRSSRLVVVLTVLAMATTTTLGLLFRAHEDRELLSEHLRSEELAAETGAAGIAALLDGFNSDLDRLTRVRSVRYLQDPERLERTLRSFRQRTVIDSVALVRIDTAGGILFTYPEDAVPAEVLEALTSSGYLARVARSKEPVLSAPFQIRKREHVVALSDLIKPKASDPLGAMIAVFPVSSLAGPLAGLTETGERTVLLRFEDGSRLRYRNKAATRGVPAVEQAGDKLAARAAVADRVAAGLGVELWSTRDAALAPRRRSRSRGLLLLILLNGLIGTGGVFLARELRIRKRLESAEAHYRRVVQSSPHGIFVLDALGRFVELNPAGERILARAAREVAGRAFAEVLAAGDRERAEDAFRRMMSSHEQVEVELRVQCPSGDTRLISLVGVATRDRDVVSGMYVMARDITEEVEREQRLRRAERLASVGTLLGGVAHELNNPLAAIRGFSELLLLEPRAEEEREDLETILREADRMAKIVSNLRTVARQTQGEDQGTREAVDLNDIVRHVLKVRRYALETHNVEVCEDLAQPLPGVWANRAEIEQVLLNLVVNAEQALAGDGQANRRLTVRTRPSRTGATVHVIDNGPGIAPEHRERIFDPFFTTKAPGEGTGLGLSLVHGIVHEHGGELRVESEPGQGATFTLGLPRAPEQRDTQDPQPAGVLKSGAGLRLLVVDDEEAIRRSLSRFLSRRGHQVDTAADGGEALRLLESAAASEPYDIILSDLRMPGLGGEQLLRLLRDRGDGSAERVIFMTGDAASEGTARFLQTMAKPAIEKPFTLAEVAERIERQAVVPTGGPPKL